MPDITKNFEPHDVLIAFSLLTRLPVPVDHVRAGQRAAQAAWAYPIVGLVLGILAGFLGLVLGWLSIPSGMVAGFIILAMVMATGAMHEDGLADFADGIWGGNTVERRLEIMKDSRIGAYGATALFVFLLLRFSGIATIEGWTLITIIAAVAAASRGLMVAVMFMLDPAKSGGLSASAGQPSATQTGVALGISLAACVLLTGLSGVVLFLIMALAFIPASAIALKKLNGQTGDVLGAAQQCCEIAGLAAAIAFI